MKQRNDASSCAAETIGSKPPQLRKAVTVVGSIPGLERLLPGHYRPGGTVRSHYGTWILPRRFRGHPLLAIIDGSMLG